MTSELIDVDDAGRLVVRVAYTPDHYALCQAIPGERVWDTMADAWLARLTAKSLRFVRTAFPPPTVTWSAAAAEAYERLVATVDRTVVAARKKRYAAAVVPDDYVHGGPAPRIDQRQAFALSWEKKAFALLMEMRTGKTKVVIDTAFQLYKRDRIAQVLVIAPNNVKSVWVDDELPKHAPNDDWVALAWRSSRSKTYVTALHRLFTQESQLRWFVINVEALSTERGKRVALRFVKAAPTLTIIDESTRIKTPGAARTKAAIVVGKLSRYRRILTGTPFTQSPLDGFAQFTFLDPAILGVTSFYAFRNRYAVIDTITTGIGNVIKKVVGYRDLEVLDEKIERHCYRVRSAECLDLPPKTYEKRVVELASEQRKAYNAMRDEMLVKISETERVTATIVLTQLLRLQQIIGGFFPRPERLSQFEANVFAIAEGLGIATVAVGKETIDVTDGSRAIVGPNPKLNALVELIDDVDGKLITWARFRPEIALIVATLRERYGNDAVVEYHGGTSEDDRTAARRAFQTVDDVRFFVGQQHTGGMGIALDTASCVAYYSNTFSLEDRLQSEDRAIGRNKILYVDIVAEDTIDDTLIVPALRGRRELASIVLREPIAAWL